MKIYFKFKRKLEELVTPYSEIFKKRKVNSEKSLVPTVERRLNSKENFTNS
jgi:hypothetical protein